MAPSGSLIHALIRHLWPRNSMARRAATGGIGGFFCSAPQDFLCVVVVGGCWLLGVFCALRFARAFLLGPREARYIFAFDD